MAASRQRWCWRNQEFCLDREAAEGDHFPQAARRRFSFHTVWSLSIGELKACLHSDMLLSTRQHLIQQRTAPPNNATLHGPVLKHMNLWQPNLLRPPRRHAHKITRDKCLKKRSKHKGMRMNTEKLCLLDMTRPLHSGLFMVSWTEQDQDNSVIQHSSKQSYPDSVGPQELINGWEEKIMWGMAWRIFREWRQRDT